MPEPWVIVGVPIDSVGRAGGTELAPAALRERDLAARLGVEDRGDLDVRIRGDHRDPATGVIDIDGVVATTEAVRAAVCRIAVEGGRPLVLGGCCTLVPGALAGLVDAGGPVGVAYVDGHVDVYDGELSPTGEAADMPMSVAFGLGRARWADAAGGTCAAPEGTVVLGARDPEEARDIAALRAGALAALEVHGPDELRADGLATVARRAAQRLGSRLFVHLDLDVLDERAMPATDYLMPGGLQWDELAAVLGPLGRSPALAGLSLGCLNPDKDPDGRFTEMTCALLVEALAGG